MLTMNEMIQSASRFERIFLNHRNCGVMMLQRISAQ